MTFHCWVFEAYCREYPTRNLELGIPDVGYSRCGAFRTRTTVIVSTCVNNTCAYSHYPRTNTCFPITV